MYGSRKKYKRSRKSRRGQKAKTNGSRKFGKMPYPNSPFKRLS